jgi:signal transduction histidine kinase
MRRLPIYLLYAAAALRGALQVEDRRDPTLTIILLGIYGLLLFSESQLSRQLAARAPRLVDRYHVLYILLQSVTVLAMLVPERTPDTFLIFYFPLSFQAVEFFGWRTGRWWIAGFTVPTLIYVILHPEPTNAIMAVIYESGCFLLGALAGMMLRAEAARARNLELVADLQAAQAEMRRYAAQVEELAAERARTALARELHDSVTQTVFSLNLAVETANLMLSQAPASTAAQLDRIQDLAQHAMREIGELVSHLQPQSTESSDLLSGIRKITAAYRYPGELEAKLHVAGGGRELPASVSNKLCKIVQEALANTKKHAATSQVYVRVSLTHPAWVEVEDCGRGFDSEAAMGQAGHLGLPEMAEMAREIGWTLTIQSQPGQGTRVRIEEPAGVEA